MDRLLLFHGIGSGKTCSAISLAASYSEQTRNKIVVVVPASLRENFMKELRGPCGAQMNHRANKFDLMSYQGFVKRYKEKTLKLNNTMVIIDEVQNIISETGSMYKLFLEALQNMENSKLICLSATPMFDKPIEIALLGNLMLSREEYARFRLPTEPPVFSRMMSANPMALYTFFKNRISHFRGADPRAYPRKTEHRVDCVMSSFQRQAYMESIGHMDMRNLNKQIQRAFLISPRQVSNLVLPNGHIGKLRNIPADFDVKKHAIKFYKCIQKIRDSPGPVFVYSNFVTVAGIEAFAAILSKVHGYSQVVPNTPHTSRLRYGIFRANKPVENDKLLALYNSPQNRDGSIVKVIIGSPTMKEGVTLLRTRQIHLLDPYWNRSRTEQVMGRGVRFCSHADLPASDRHVDVYHYYAVPSPTALDVSVDLRILQLSNAKIRKINVIETILKETAVDCPLFKERNEPPTLHCFSHNIVSDHERDRLLMEIPKDKKNSPKDQQNSPKDQQNSPKDQQNSPKDQQNSPKDPTDTVVKPKPVKPLSFGKKTTIRTDRKKRVKSSCPSTRRPDEKGKCPDKHPFRRINKNGDICCFVRDLKATKKGPKMCPPNKILNPKTKRCVLRESTLGRKLAT
jgi:superfamily II DNA or RNA helicase